MSLRKNMLLAMSVAFIMPVSAALAEKAVGHITGTFTDTVHIFGLDRKPLGHINASDIINQPLLGKDPKTGLYEVQTKAGLVLVKPGAVQTDIKEEAPPVTPCLVMNAGSLDTAAGSSNNLTSNCTSR